MAKSGFGAAQAAVEQAQKSAQGAVEFNKFSVKQDEPAKRVRFLIEDGDDSVLTFLEHWTEMNNAWKRNFACPNEEFGQDNCVVCRGKKGSDFVSDQRKNAHMIQLINRETGQIEVWKFSPMAMSLLLEILNNNGNISDRDYTIQFLSNEDGKVDPSIKSKFLYVIKPVGEPTPLSAADQELIKGRYKLTNLIPKYDEDNLTRIMAMKPGEGGKKDATKPAVQAKDFLSALGGGSTNMATDLFKGITSAGKAEATVAVTAEEKAVVSPVPVEAVTAETPATESSNASDDFLKLLNDMK